MRTTPLAILTLGLAFASSFAQSHPNSWDNLKQLRQREKIKVVDTQLKSWTGNFVTVSEEALVVRTLEGLVTVERARVLRVTNIEKSKRLRNAAIGFAACGVTAGSLVASEMGGYAALFGAWVGGACAGAAGLIPSYPTIYRSRLKPPGVRPGPQVTSESQQVSKPESKGVN